MANPPQIPPGITVTCPGTVTFDCSLTAVGDSSTSADLAWNTLQTNMPNGVEVANFVQAVAAATPHCPGAGCGETSTQTPVCGYSVSVTKDAQNPPQDVYQYSWTWTITVAVTCTTKKKLVLSPGKPLIPIAVPKEGTPGGELKPAKDD